MDVDQARTFLAIVETGSFVEAAKRVFVTQSTVSSRIKTLEEQLRKTLFIRGKTGTVLTPAGVLFQKHAQTMVRAWEHARLEIALPDGYQASLTVGGQYSLWDGFLLEWLARMRTQSPEIAVRARLGFSNSLMQALINGELDLAVMYTPQARPGFEVAKLFEDELVLVTSQPDLSEIPGDNYVFIDWGPEFRADHALNFPQISTPGTYLELGSLSVQYLVRSGSSGYVPRRLIKSQEAADQLVEVQSAPVFSYPAYAVYPIDSDPELQVIMMDRMRSIAEPFAT